MKPKSHILCSRECRRIWREPTYFQVGSHFGNWNPNGFSHFQKVISGVKTHWIEEFSLGRGESYESIYAHGSPVHQKCSNYMLTNLLFSLCKSMWIIEPLVTCFSPHLETLICSSTFEMLQAREHTPTPSCSIGLFLDSQLCLSKSFGCVMYISPLCYKPQFFVGEWT